MYSKMGMAVCIRVASPAMVVKATLEQPSSLTIPRAWPYDQQTSSPSLPSSSTTMEGLAWNVLAEIDSLLPHHPIVFFHVFSNAGCFLWEQVTRILRPTGKDAAITTEPTATIAAPRPIQLRLQSIADRIHGVIFDSGPGNDLHQLPLALSYATLLEKLGVVFSTRYLLLPWSQQRVEQRAKDYANTFRQDGWDLPQLYFFCESDALAPHEFLRQLVEHRQQAHGVERIQCRVWKESTHCAHLYRHPHEYRATLSSFLDQCIMLSLRSRL